MNSPPKLNPPTNPAWISMTTFFVALWIVTALYSILFFVLYVGVVRLRIGDARVKVHRPGILFGRQRYVECYLGLLSNEEKSRWYNVFLKYSFDIGLALSTTLLFYVIVLVIRGMG